MDMDAKSAAEAIHVCIITTGHPVDDVRVNNKIAHAFKSAGFKVSWVGPGHAFFDRENYNRDGIEFHLAPPIHSRMDRLICRFHIKRMARSIRKVDVYYSPEPDSAVIAVDLAKRSGARSVVDIHEIYHGTNLDKWLGRRRMRPLRELVRRWIAKTCRRSDLVMGVSDAVLDPLLPDRSTRLVVRSCAPSWFADAATTVTREPEGLPFRIMHGKGHLSYGTGKVLEALQLVRKHVASPRLLVMATGEPAEDPTIQALVPLAEGLGILDALDFRPGVPFQEMPEVLRTCDVGLISYGRGLGTDILPNRLFEYLAQGLPVIAPVYAVEVARIIEKEQCGLLVDFEDPAAIAEAILRLEGDRNLCREMGRRGREGFLARHNWEVEVEPLLQQIRRWYPTKGRA